jgi:hypothetical protein
MFRHKRWSAHVDVYRQVIKAAADAILPKQTHNILGCEELSVQVNAWVGLASVHDEPAPAMVSQIPGGALHTPFGSKLYVHSATTAPDMSKQDAMSEKALWSTRQCADLHGMRVQPSSDLHQRCPLSPADTRTQAPMWQC